MTRKMQRKQGRLIKRISLPPAIKEALETAAVRLCTSESVLVEESIRLNPRITQDVEY